jgi:hypothetical protein
MSRDYRDSVPVISRIAQNIDVGRNLRLAALDALFDPLPVVVTQSYGACLGVSRRTRPTPTVQETPFTGEELQVKFLSDSEENALKY